MTIPRLGRSAIVALACASATSAAVAQDAQTALAEPVPLFQAVCISGSARLSRGVAEPASYGTLPTAARHALGASTVATRAEAEKLPAPAPAAVSNTMYRIAGGQVYLLVPGKAASAGAIGESCVVLWHPLSDDDYLAARKLVLPDEDRVPLEARPTASALGASAATITRGGVSLTVASYGGWLVLRSQPLSNEPTAPGAQ